MKHGVLHLKNIFFHKSSIQTGNEISDLRRIDLFVLTGNENSGNTNQLELSSVHVYNLQEPINEVDCQKESLVLKPE
jgi:hypothetical protein